MVLDERAEKLVDILIGYSLNIGSEDSLLIRSERPFNGFAQMIGDLAIEKGAKVIYEFYELGDRKEVIERSDDKELEKESKRICKLAERSTAAISISAETDPFFLQGVDSKKIAKYAEIVSQPYIERVIGNGKEFKGIKWNVVGFPCEARAKSIGMTLEEYADFVYGATNIDWAKAGEEMKKVKEAFDGASDVHIYVPGRTDLHLSLSGRGGQICDGKYNMPDGEVFYGPVEDSANGYIYFPYSSVRDGNIVSGIRLEYKDGGVVSFDAEENKAFLESMLELEGVKRIGELGIGCNYGIQKYIENLLFDEKIGGTIHLAIGNSYKEPLSDGGGLNEGKIHWDIVCELRKMHDNPGGSIYVDGKLVQQNGVWTF